MQEIEIEIWSKMLKFLDTKHFLNLCFVHARSQKLYILKTLNVFAVLAKTFLLCNVRVLFQNLNFSSFWAILPFFGLKIAKFLTLLPMQNLSTWIFESDAL